MIFTRCKDMPDHCVLQLRVGVIMIRRISNVVVKYPCYVGTTALAEGRLIFLTGDLIPGNTIFYIAMGSCYLHMLVTDQKL